jgi:hypothetical protein
MTEVRRYPLTWPHDCPRTPDGERRQLPSGTYRNSIHGPPRTVGFNDTIRRVLREIGLLNCKARAAGCSVADGGGLRLCVR